MNRHGDEIRGRLAPQSLLRAPELFDQSIASIVSELLQNARRARATEVTISIMERDGRKFVVVKDDGIGITDFQPIVSFGRSSWDASVKGIEDTAGMGTFCLSARGCEILSHGASVTLSPGVFVGTESARVERAPLAPRDGTMIIFPLDGSGFATKPSELADAVRCEAFYSPVKVRLGTDLLPRREFLEFAVAVEEHDGIAIGLYDKAAFQQRRQHHSVEAGFFSPAPKAARLISFGGHLATTPSTVRVGRDGGWFAMWEVRQNPSLRLTLPTRDTVVADDAWHALEQRTRLSLCRIASQRTPKALKMSEVLFARSKGLDLPDVDLDLRIFPEETSSSGEISSFSSLSEDAGSSAVVVPASMLFHSRHALIVALASGQVGTTFVSEDPDLDGLPQYDALRRVVGIYVDMEVVGEKESVTLYEGNNFEEEGAFELIDIAEEYGGKVTSLAIRVKTAGGAEVPHLTELKTKIPLLALRDGAGYGSRFSFIRSRQLTSTEIPQRIEETMQALVPNGFGFEGLDTTPIQQQIRSALLPHTKGGAKIRLNEAMDAVESILRNAHGQTLSGDFAELNIYTPSSMLEEHAIIIEISNANGDSAEKRYTIDKGLDDGIDDE